MRLACSWSQQIKSEIGLTCEACAWIPQVAQGIIWVWGENGPDAALESAVTPAPLIPELDDAEAVESGRVTAGAIYQRDLPYSWETFIENVVVSCAWSMSSPRRCLQLPLVVSDAHRR